MAIPQLIPQPKVICLRHVRTVVLPFSNSKAPSLALALSKVETILNSIQLPRGFPSSLTSLLKVSGSLLSMTSKSTQLKTSCIDLQLNHFNSLVHGPHQKTCMGLSIVNGFGKKWLGWRRVIYIYIYTSPPN